MTYAACFLPCRKGSQRIPRENIKPFAGFQNGLVEIKLNQLIAADYIDEIHLSTNDDEILNFASSIGSSKIRLHKRRENLSSSETSTDELVAHALELIGDDKHILWTHVTSPFVTAKLYDNIIKTYFEKLNLGFDSLMAIKTLHGFLWNNDGPINYDRKLEKWPRTQTLAPVYEINSAAFVAPSAIYRDSEDRIGEKPFLYAMDNFLGMDIDWPEEFSLGEQLMQANLVAV